MAPLGDSERARRTRRTIIDIAKRRQRPGTGSALSLLNDRTARMQWPDLRGVLEGIPWAVAGGVATRKYMAERATEDLDIVVLAVDANKAADQLDDGGYVNQGELAIGGTSWLSPQHVRVDVIEGREGWWPRALEESAANPDAQGFPVLTLPYLVLMKLLAGRSIDMGDLTRMLGGASDEVLESVRTVVAEHAGDLSDDLESLIELGKLEWQG